jgi:V8-like Glu-specific endopeptidase
MQNFLTIFAVITFWTLVAPAALSQDADESWLYERKILGNNNLIPIGDIGGTLEYKYAGAIARVERSDGSPFCTASRVGKNLFMTNFHCDHDCATTQFTMGTELGKPVSEKVTYLCKELVHKAEEFDYALYRVELAPNQAQIEYPIMTLSAADVYLDQSIFVAGHPSGRLKEVDISNECVISDIVPELTDSGRNTIKHMCDTEGGSSGSPLIDRNTGYAVGLHWGGKTDAYNMAIPMALIIKNLKAEIPRITFKQLKIVGLSRPSN